jgi:hypothetical protein
MCDFFAMDDAAMERAVQLLPEDDLEVEAHHPGWGIIAGAVTLGLAGGVIYEARRIKGS